jgi:hypothetical protein
MRRDRQTGTKQGHTRAEQPFELIATSINLLPLFIDWKCGE